MAITKVVMPKLSEAMESGKIIKWIKKEGERVQSGDILAEVETDKADVEMEAFGGGVLRKILVSAGDKAAVGSLIAVIADESEDINSVVGQAGGGAPAQTAAAPSAAKPAVADRPAAAPPQPKSEDHAARTPAPSRGPEAPTSPRVAEVVAQQPAATMAPARPSADGGRVKASPLARKIAAQSGVDLKLIQGSGPGGRIVRRDVEAAQSAPAAAATGPALRPAAQPTVTGPEFEDVPLTAMRSAIAKRMPLSKAPVPHFYVTSEVAMDRAWVLREELNALDGQPKISVLSLIHI